MGSIFRTTPIVIVILFIVFSTTKIFGQGFPNPASLSTGQGTPGTLDPIWTVSAIYPTVPPNPIGLSFTPALINNNCAPGAWVDPATLPPPVNNGNWITNPGSPCATNTLDGYTYFRLTLDLPTDCHGNSVTVPGNYVLYFDGYVDNTITDVFVNGASMGISGGAFAPGTGLTFSLPGPWIQGTNYVDVLVYNFPNGGQANPYGLLLVPNVQATNNTDSDGDGIADIDDDCPCAASNLPGGCPPLITGDTIICLGETTVLKSHLAGDYLWSTSATADSIIVSPITNTSYSVTVTETSGTTHTKTVMVTVNPLPTVAINPAPAAVCIGNSIILTASGGGSYQWSTTDATSAITVSPTTNTPYTVTVTDGNGCSASATQTVTVNPLPTPGISPTTAAICSGNNITLTASGGTSYLWSNTDAVASTTVSPISNTTYTVTVTDANNCSASTNRSVTVNALPTPSISPATATICVGDNVTLTASGGTGYVWSNTDNTAATAVSPITNTTYTVTVTDANNCSASTNRSVTVNPLPTPVISPATATICVGDNIALTASGGTAYLWSNTDAVATTTVSPIANTTYTVTVTDANNCSASASKSVTVNPLPTPVISPATATICSGDNITLTASGGTAYLWSNTDAVATTTVSPATNTTYTVTVTDGNNCSASASRGVTVNPLPVPTISPTTAAICIGDNITLTVNGGAAYQWSTSEVTAAITVSPAVNTTYTVTATDANGCSATTTKGVTVNPLPTPAISPATATICEGDNITLTASGGTGFVWSNALATASINVAPTSNATYDVTVTDANGCTATDTRSVTVNPLSGSVVLAVRCSYQTYTSPKGRVLNTTGIYYDTLTSSLGCDSIIRIDLQMVALDLALTATETLCQGDATGTITGTHTGGRGPVSYQWSDASFSGNNISNAYAGTFTATITDALGCTATQTIQVTEPDSLVLTANVVDVSCFGKGDGSITMAATGGTAGYEMWLDTTMSSTGSFANLGTGTYAVQLVDANGCQQYDTLTIVEPDSFMLFSAQDSLWMELGDTLAMDMWSNFDPATQYHWNPHAGLDCTDCPNPNFWAHDHDTLHLTAITQSPYQNVECFNKFDVPVWVKENKNLFIPTAFSPNGDTQNDVYRAYGNLKGLRIFNIKVFDRWGALVFESNDPYFQWDGLYHGQLASGGIYIYVAQYAWLSAWEVMHTEQGSLTVLR